MIEDIDAEAQQILREIQNDGYYVNYQCVETRAAMDAALSHQVWDIILCDDNLPHFSPIEVLSTLKESRQKIPFFLRAGISGEDTLVTIFQLVAQDFIVKENLIQLLPGLAQELRDIQSRRSHKYTA